ncbi:hypothetical protein DLAC_02327 [Tieghemostelium lacteum]|uniref:C2H2-type domain-containing protein n=1 Tax=Tieghemostelium lacteum TaxID=361077 RepID=A0A152A4P8_TIELA|nr:hypothetical protein DLAC_02327 [Tieghemostelium lacteum]|eukprot:KYR01209.1 hypothetical protein DLAC_02327 [Tieghemostelium lacteum]
MDKEKNNNNATSHLKSLPEYYSNILDLDYFQETILEPLSIKTELKQQTIKSESPVKSPIKEDPYFCNYCKKRFQTESTWTQHLNSSKHKQLVKDQKKLDSSSSPNKSPVNIKQTHINSPPSSTSSISSSNSSSRIDKEFLNEQQELVKQSLKTKQSKPNLSCKNLFQVSKNYSQHNMIRESAVCLYYILDILKLTKSNDQSNIEAVKCQWNNIYNNTLSLQCKTHLYLARLTRTFDKQLSESHFINSFFELQLIGSSDLDKLESNIKVPGNLLNVYKEILNTVQSIPIPTTDSTVIQNLIDEVSGGLCFQTFSDKSMILYFISLSISTSCKRYQDSLKSIQRIIKLLKSIESYWLIDFYMYSLEIIIGNKQTDTDEFKSNLFQLLKYCIVFNDKIRLLSILKYLKDNQIDEEQQLSDDYLQFIYSLSIAYLNTDYKTIGNLIDEYEYIIQSNNNAHSREFNYLLQFIDKTIV